ncbi:hypothetical protein LGW42_09880, partial [Streptococcus mutans]|nr:hypothetical protein [Streptococcus mutans]
AIIFAFLYFTNNHKTDLESTISEQWNKITTFFSNDFSLPDTMSKLSTDNYKHEAGSRWSQNSASVYIASTDKTIVKAYQTALANWNATGSFTFNIISDKASADITAKDYSDVNSQAAGLAETETNAVTNRMSHVDVKLNRYYLLDASNGYNPLKYPEEAKFRRDIVLTLMPQHGKITEAQMKEAKQASITEGLTTEEQRLAVVGSKYDAFLDVVIGELEESGESSALAEGITVYTTLD